MSDGESAKLSDKFQEIEQKFNETEEYWRSNYQRAEEDLHFISDEPGAQWDEELYNARINSGAPALSLDQLDQFISIVANEVKSNTPTINVYPSDAMTNKEDAEIIKGVVRSIEYRSGADDAYDYALLSAIRCGIGWMRVIHQYVEDAEREILDDETPREKELLIEKVSNPLSVYLDPSSVKIDGSDAMFGFIQDEISIHEFEKLFPKENPVSFGDDPERILSIDEKPETVKILNYYEVVIEDGQRLVKEAIINGEGVISETYFPGKYVPLIPCYGIELWVKNQRRLMGLIRKAKEPQKMYNLWRSVETEILLNQPLAPITAVEGQVEDYAEDWQNPSKSAVLRYKAKTVNGELAPPPSRVAPPQIPAGFVQASNGAREDIKSTMGLYDSSLGARSNEKSGVAIQERKAQGALATYHFGDNLFKSIAHLGRVVVKAIPNVYGDRQAMQIIGKEEEPEIIGVNGNVFGNQKRSYDLTKGSYEVRVTTGAPFSSLRQEAAQTLMELMANRPELMQIFGDLLFKSMDFPGAQDIAERIKATMDPKVIQAGKDQQEMDPQAMAMAQQMQQAQQMIGQLQQQLEAMAQQLEQAKSEKDIKIQSEMQKRQLEMSKLRFEQEKAAGEYELKQRELNIKEDEISFKLAQARSEERIAQVEHILNQLLENQGRKLETLEAENERE